MKVLLIIILLISQTTAFATTGKTADPEGMTLNNLTSHTTWEWLIKGGDGNFHPSGQVVDMDAYDSYTLSQRAIILKHKEVELEMDEAGTIVGFHGQNSYGGVILGALLLLAVLGVIVVAAAQPRKRGKTLGLLYFLSLFGRDDDRL